MVDFEKLFGVLSARPYQMCNLKDVHSTGHKPYGERYRGSYAKLLNDYKFTVSKFSFG